MALTPTNRTAADGVRLLAALLGALVVLSLAPQQAAAAPWPPRTGPGELFVHYGEEHWNDDDGLTLLPRVVADTARYRPALVTMSGDKANDGNTAQLTRWREIMEVYDRAGVPYFAAVGNHDRDAPPEAGGLPPPGSIEPYKEVFRGRPYPMGDAGPRPPGDPPGASTHYFVDRGNARWVFIDNSCFAIEECDLFQNPSAQNAASRPQLTWLRDVAGAASRAGKVVFVVMHMPTRDPGDQSYREPTALNHVMGKGVGTDDNAKFEQAAEQAGVDGVFLGHIKAQFLYRGLGGVPYFIDGGAGGELYTEGPVGTDHGYWHGYRLVRVEGQRVTTDAVPIFVPGGITVSGPRTMRRGEAARFEAFGRQPVFNNSAKVNALELRDPDPVPRGLISQRGEPTSTPVESLPNPARIWTTASRFVLSPVASQTEDARRNPRTQTHDGAFRARCPGKTRVRIDSGMESAARWVVVPSNRGRIVRSVRLRRRAIRAGRRARVARVGLAQPAEVLVRVRRRGRTRAVLRHTCRAARAPLAVAWDGRLRRRPGRGRLRAARPGRYRVDVLVRSDRRTVRRSRLVTLRAGRR